MTNTLKLSPKQPQNPNPNDDKITIPKEGLTLDLSEFQKLNNAGLAPEQQYMSDEECVVSEVQVKAYKGVVPELGDKELTFLYFGDNDICFALFCVELSVFLPEDLTCELELHVVMIDCTLSSVLEIVAPALRLGGKLTVVCVAIAGDIGSVFEPAEETVGTSGEMICFTKSMA